MPATDLETRKRLETEALAIANKGGANDTTTVLLGILATLQSIDYKLWKATKDKH